MAKNININNSLNLVQNALNTHNYQTAMNNLKILHGVFNRNDMKYSYLASLERCVKKLYKLYFYGGNSTNIEKTIQFAESYIGMLKA